MRYKWHNGVYITLGEIIAGLVEERLIKETSLWYP
jgi:hypothetical protein